MVVIGIQFLIIFLFFTCLLFPEPTGDAANPAVDLKKIHDVAAQARLQGKIFSRTDVEKALTGLQAFERAEVIGTDSHWTILLTVPREPQTKLERLLFTNREWPVYVLTSEDDGFITISPNGKITHSDFNW